MRLLKIVVTLICFSLPHVVLADFKDTSNVTVALISVWTNNGDVLVQTNPRPDISGLTCTNDYWLRLNKSEVGFDATLAMLLSAHAAKHNISVSAQDNDGDDFCRLRRVIILPN